MATKIGPKTVTQRDRSKNLVFCIDAAHSDSYGGEPADNLFTDPNNFGGADWNQPAGTWAVSSDPGPHGNGSYSCTATDSDPYIYSHLVHDVATGNITFSCWVKGTGSTVGKSGDIRINFVAGGGNATGGNAVQGWGPLSGNWQRVSVTQNVTGAGKIKVGIEAPNSAVVGDVVYVSDPQLEQGQATTPFTATSRTAANAIKNISGVGAQGTTLTGTFATYGLGGLFRPTTRKVLASEDSNRGHIGAVYWDLDGSDEAIDCYDMNEETGTLAFWMKSTFSGSYSYPFGKQKGTETLAMSMHSSNSPSHSGNFWVRQTDGGSSSVQTNAALNDGVWHQVVAMWGVGGLKIYVDGEFNDGDTTFTGHGNAASGDSNFGLGCILQSGGPGFECPGQFATLMVWSSQLTSKEVKDIYIAQKGRFGK